MAQQQSSDWQPRREAQPLSSTSGQRMILRLRDLRVARKDVDQQPSPSAPEYPAPRPTIQPPEKSISWLEELEAAEAGNEFHPEHLPTNPLGDAPQNFTEFALDDKPEEEDLDQLSLLPPGQSIPPISLIPDSAPSTETAPHQSSRPHAVSPRRERPPAGSASDPDREQRRVAILRGAWLNRAYITGISATILLATYLILNGFGSQKPDSTPKLDDSLFTFEDELPSSKLNEAPAWSPHKESETVVTSDDSYVPRFDGSEEVPFIADRPNRETNPRLNPGLPTTIVGPNDREPGTKREPVTNSTAARESDGYQPSFAPPGNDDLEDTTFEGAPQFGYARDFESDSPPTRNGTVDPARQTLDQESSAHWALDEPVDSAEPRNQVGRLDSAYPSNSTHSWEMPSTESMPATSDNKGWLDNSQSASQASPRRSPTPQRDWNSLEDSPPRNDFSNVSANRGESYVDRNTVQNPYVQQSVQQPTGFPTIESYEPYPPQGPRQAELLGIEPHAPEIRR